MACTSWLWGCQRFMLWLSPGTSINYGSSQQQQLAPTAHWPNPSAEGWEDTKCKTQYWKLLLPSKEKLLRSENLLCWGGSKLSSNVRTKLQKKKSSRKKLWSFMLFIANNSQNHLTFLPAYQVLWKFVIK